VVFVNGRGRPEIMEDMRRRIERGDYAAEEREAIEAMCAIAKDRARKLLAAAPAEAVGR
jgi:2-oxo-4-hydroxy-4-carboxy--5-ureidoimidazoline (OHCU) decarboxylase